MTWDRIEADWGTVKSAAQNRWNKLTNEELEAVGGNRDRLIHRIAERYEHTKEEAAKMVDQWVSDLDTRAQHAKLAQEIERLKAEIASLAQSAGDAVREGSQEAAKKASNLGKELEAAIERNPMQAVLIAAGVGLLLGLLTKSRDS